VLAHALEDDLLGSLGCPTALAFDALVHNLPAEPNDGVLQDYCEQRCEGSR
jgi:hypothetical protein